MLFWSGFDDFLWGKCPKFFWGPFFSKIDPCTYLHYIDTLGAFLNVKRKHENSEVAKSRKFAKFNPREIR